jgi:uncharacterized membrane protein YhdT
VATKKSRKALVIKPLSSGVKRNMVGPAWFYLGICIYLSMISMYIVIIYMCVYYIYYTYYIYMYYYI